MIYLLDFRTANVGGAVGSGVLVVGAGLGTEHDLRAESNITFLIHGFNVNREAGTASLQRLAQALPSTTAYVGVLWPGDHWIRAASYPFEGKDADDSAVMLTRYIVDVVSRGSRLSFISHSLGARVALETVKRLNQTDYPVLQVCLLAAAIDDFSVSNPTTYLPAATKTQRVAVLASKKDTVLSLAYPAGDLLQAFIFFRRDQPGLALGFHGPKPHKTQGVPAQVYHEQIPDSRSANHGHYFPDTVATPNQASAVAFAIDVLGGVPQPKYL